MIICGNCKIRMARKFNSYVCPNNCQRAFVKSLASNILKYNEKVYFSYAVPTPRTFPVGSAVWEKLEDCITCRNNSQRNDCRIYSIRGITEVEKLRQDIVGWKGAFRIIGTAQQKIEEVS